MARAPGLRRDTPPIDTPWRSALEGERARRSIDAARDVAGRLVEREVALAATAAAARQTAFPTTVYWEPAGIAQGDAGLALVYGYLDACFPSEGWDATAHAYLSAAAAGAERGPLPPGIFAGLSGLAFAAWSLSRGGTRYQRLLATLDDALIPQAFGLADAVASRRDGASVGEIDAISGLSGIGAYLLCRRESPTASAGLEAVLGALVELTGNDDDPPRWRTPAELMGDESMAAQYPDGNLNCGLAHGIPGPLALMSLALAAGVEVAGLSDAVARIAGWLTGHRADDGWGANWPVAVSLTPTGWEEPTRSAWCYGSPGVARSLWLAGRALDDGDLRELAVEAMAAVYRRPVHERRIDSPTFCHGIAGLLQITLRFAADTRLPIFFEAAEALTDQLLAAYEPEGLLGFYSIEPDGRHVDQPGLLDGAPGVALVLLAASQAADPVWDRLFLLS